METADRLFTAIDIGHLYAHSGAAMFLISLMFLAVLGDFISGIYTARHLGQRIHSHKLRATVNKLVPYLIVMLMAFIFDVALSVLGFYIFPYVMLAVTLAIIAIEIVSVLEHAKRRKSKAAKIPEMLSDIADYIGHDELKRILTSMAEKALEESTSQPSKSELQQ